MIKSEMGSVSMRGTTPVLISELALAICRCCHQSRSVS